MKEEIKYNLINYLKDNATKQKVLVVLVALFLFLIIVFYLLFSVIQVETTNALTSCNNTCHLEFYLTDVQKNNKFRFIKVGKKQYNIKDIEFLEPEINSVNQIVQKVQLELENYDGKNNEIVELKLYKNKETMLKKIVRIILER